MVPGRAGKGGRGCHVFRIQIGGGRMFTNQIKTVNLDGISDFERIDSELRTLIVTMAGSLPGSRGFGLSAAFLSDLPMNAISAFAEELDEKCEEFIPDISISGVDFDAGTDGNISVQIYVERRDGV